MNLFFLILIIDAFPIQKPPQFDINNFFSKKTDVKTCKDENIISHIGYYSFRVKKKCEIVSSLNSGSVRMFFFYDPIFQIDYNLSIDGQYVDAGPKNANGRSIVGNDNVTIKFYNIFSNKMIVNIWLLPLHLCSNLSLYAYNSYSIDLKIPYTSSEICIFSPSSDSSNNKFKVKFGINSNEPNHISSLYSSSYYCPQTIAKESKIVSTRVYGSYLVEFKFNHSINDSQEIILTPTPKPSDINYYLNFIFYKRTTNQVVIDDINLKSSIGSVAKCNSYRGCRSDFFPPLEVHYDEPGLTSNPKIAAYLVFAIVSIIAVIIIIAIFVVRIKRQKERINKQKNKDNVPLNIRFNNYTGNEGNQGTPQAMEVHSPENWEYLSFETKNNSVKARRTPSLTNNNDNLL